jgi:YegS/Rv2252/BmrU family lipid kinase
VVLNAWSGDGSAEQVRSRLIELFAAANRPVSITLARNGSELARAIGDALAAGVDTLAVGGGDGTLSTAAAALAGTDTRLGVLPLGTLNHFAKDLGIPLGLDEATGVVLAGHTTRVDVGEVNGKVFLNNSSLGLYPRVLRLRERHPAHGWKKWLVALWAAVKLMRHHPNMRVRIETGGRTLEYRTPVVFIGNNEYQTAGITTGVRKSLADGLLAIYVVRSRGRPRLLRLAWRMFTGKVVETGELDVLKAASARIEIVGARSIEAALDGELTGLDLPLQYRIYPAALTVLVASPGPATAPPA